MSEPSPPDLGRVVASHRAKLSRARYHLDEMRELLKPYTGVKAYDVTSVYDADTKEWVYSARVPDLSDGLLPVLTESWLPVIVGDFLFNVRSALDHLAVAHAPNRRKRSASFPIVTEDIEVAAPSNAQLKSLKYFESATEGMDPNVVKAIRSVQPYREVPPYKEVSDPRWGVGDHLLALLSSFQNADKHRELAVVAQGLRPHTFRYLLPDGTRTRQAVEPLTDDRLLRDGAVVERLGVKAEMALEGEIEVVISRTSGLAPMRGLESFASSLLKLVNDRVFDPIDAMEVRQ